MRALSFRQPWADSVVSGMKKEDIRSWKITHRGSLAIHASQKIDLVACEKDGVNPQELTAGAVIGFVNLVDIQPLDNQKILESQKDSGERKKLFVWKFTDPQPLIKPFPTKGRKGVFHVPDEIFVEQNIGFAESEVENEPITADSRAPFEMHVMPENANNISIGSYRLAIKQIRQKGNGASYQTLNDLNFHPVLSAPQKMISELGGVSLKVVADAVLEALRRNGYSATQLNAQRQEPFYLTEESGVRLALIFLALQSLKKTNRMEEVSRGIQKMTTEELYYWFAKSTSQPKADRALKALRLLLADE